MTDPTRKLALANVRRARWRREKAERDFADTLRKAAEAAPQRAIADAADLSLASVNRIIHGGQRA